MRAYRRHLEAREILSSTPKPTHTDMATYRRVYQYDQYQGCLVGYLKLRRIKPQAAMAAGAIAAALPALFVWSRFGLQLAAAAMAATWFGSEGYRLFSIFFAAWKEKESRMGRSLCIPTEADRQRYKEVKRYMAASAVANGTAPPPKPEVASKPGVAVISCVTVLLAWWAVLNWNVATAVDWVDWVDLMRYFYVIGVASFSLIYSL